jgi:hypothetical protein
VVLFIAEKADFDNMAQPELSSHLLDHLLESRMDVVVHEGSAQEEHAMDGAALVSMILLIRLDSEQIPMNVTPHWSQTLVVHVLAAGP